MTTTTHDASLPSFASAGATLSVACDRRILELTVERAPQADGSFTALGPRLSVREGLELTTRVYAERAVWQLAHRIVAAQRTVGGDAAIDLELVRVERLGEERRAPRAAFKALGTVRSAYYAAYDLAPFRVHIVEVSRLGLAFECERAFKPGLSWDISFDDGAGQRVRGRVDTVRTTRGLFGRSRVLTRFVAIDDANRVHVDRLVARRTEEADAEPAGAALAPLAELRERLQPPASPQRGRGLLRRR